ncbi:hypothetical protein CFP56_022685 [Quercus suber]|uniref:Uncharacterized protein n=1 Tax=Quercus suber TaxID=58331 RepID=A0AAW0LXZ2_QUESU
MLQRRDGAEQQSSRSYGSCSYRTLYIVDFLGAFGLLRVCCQFRDLRYGDRDWCNFVTNIIGTKHRLTKVYNLFQIEIIVLVFWAASNKYMIHEIFVRFALFFVCLYVLSITVECRFIDDVPQKCLFFFCFSFWDFSNVNDSAVFVIFGAGRLGFAKSGARSLAVVDDNSFEYDDITVYMGQFYVIDTLGNVSYFNKERRRVEHTNRYIRDCDGPKVVDFKVYKLDEEWGLMSIHPGFSQICFRPISCSVGGHLLFFEFHLVEYIHRLCVQQPMWHDHKAKATKGYQRFD